MSNIFSLSGRSFGLFDDVVNMLKGRMEILSKKGWSNLVWGRAWRLEDMKWNVANLVLKECDLLNKTIGRTR